ncbi:hypothetical protein [Paenibacillus spongiae]|uniref:HEAT repeat domain-containing protein n=1 Tax=Paenibacillus spongiae TaxID=2909671 RepID=A0ABY5SB71_9BACL|nr:hypothetical protein [Paenibacillus spongiae]UVI31172.1 hypothetical protein L1F29_04830 [Paenibacillus spongiae]
MIKVNTSRLYWMAGFGWYSVIIALVLFYFYRVSSGWLFWLSASSFYFFIVLMVYRFFRWNGSPWRRIHHRAMLMYAGIAGREAGLAAVEQREFDTVNACRQLLYGYIGNHNYDTATEMMQFIQDNQGEFYYQLLERHIRSLYPRASETDIQTVLIRVSNEPLTPQMAIACLILNKYGEKEAAKYVISFLKGEAA